MKNEKTLNDSIPFTIHSLLSHPSREMEWVEYKLNDKDPDMIGERISALANSAALFEKENAYILWGIVDDTLEVVGANFKPFH